MTDQTSQLIRRCLEGDGDACRQLHAAHAGRIKAYFLRSGFAWADAEDCTQETFLRAFGSLGTFDPARGSLRTWLAAIAKNVARKRWRRRGEPERFDPELAEQTLADDNPGDSPEKREELDALRACIAALPEELGRVVHLRYVDALTTRAIGAELELPESTVRLRLSEAKDHLARCLGGKGVVE